MKKYLRKLAEALYREVKEVADQFDLIADSN